jgi:hypothetical protein
MPDNNQRIAGSNTSASDPAMGAVAISYGSGNQTLATYSRGIYIGTAGNLAVTMLDGNDVTFENLAAGQVYPFAVKVIKQTGSTAAGVVLL